MKKEYNKNNKTDSGAAEQMTGAGRGNNLGISGRLKLALLVALLVIVSAAGVIYYITQSQSAPEVDRAVNVSEFAGESGLVMAEAVDMARDGDAGGAIDRLNQHLDDRDDVTPREAAHIYSTIATIQAQYVGFEAALESTKIAIDTYPDEPRYYLYAAQYYRILGDNEAASEHFRQALKVYDSGLPDGYRGPSRDFFAQHVEREE